MLSPKIKVGKLKKTIFGLLMKAITFINLLMILLGVCLQPGLAQSPAGSNYYVSLSGSDSNPGTLAAPWRTIQKAVNTVGAGGTIFVRGGTYNEGVKINKSGLPGSPITLSGYPGETAILDGGSNPAIQDNRNHEYWIVQNMTLKSQNIWTTIIGWWGDPGSSNYWIFRNNHIFGANTLRGHDNLFENNDVDGTGYLDDRGAGLQDVQDASYNNIFRNNYIHDYNTSGGQSRGIWLENHSHNDVVEGNTILNISGYYGQCIDSDGYTDIEWGHVIRKNTLVNCGNVGIDLENTWASIVEGNTVINAGQGGIIVISYGGGMCKAGGSSLQYGDTNSDGDCRGDPTENIIQQNIVINAGVVGGIVSYDAGGVHVWNNVVTGSQSVGLWLGSYPYTQNWDVRGNIFYNNKLAEISASSFASLSQEDYNDLYHFGSAGVYIRQANYAVFSLAQYQASTGKGLHSISADPQFVDPANRNYHLKSSSPAIDKSTPLNIPADFDGMPRPQGNGFDMGVYEVRSTPLILSKHLYLPTVQNK